MPCDVELQITSRLLPREDCDLNVAAPVAMAQSPATGDLSMVSGQELEHGGDPSGNTRKLLRSREGSQYAMPTLASNILRLSSIGSEDFTLSTGSSKGGGNPVRR
jgi:hypothetical protein